MRVRGCGLPQQKPTAGLQSRKRAGEPPSARLLECRTDPAGPRTQAQIPWQGPENHESQAHWAAPRDWAEAPCARFDDSVPNCSPSGQTGCGVREIPTVLSWGLPCLT